MLAKTHMIFSVAVASTPLALGAIELPFEIIPYVLGGVLMGSLFPDIDEPESAIGRKVRIISSIVSLFTKHRGFTHKFIFFLLSFTLTMLTIGVVSELNTYFLMGFSLGILLHHLGDFIVGGGKEKGGIGEYFYPFISSVGKTQLVPFIFRCKIGDIKEHIYLVLSLTLFIYNIAFIINNSVL